MIFFFGDMVSYVPGDYGASLISGGTVISLNGPTYWDSVNEYQGRYTSRNITRQLPPSIISNRNKILAPFGSGVLGGGGAPFLEPDLYCNKMVISRPLLIVDETYPYNLRGEQPGMSLPLHRLTSLSTRYEANTILTIGGERFMYMGIAIHTSNFGCYLLSLDRDWNQAFYD